MAEDKKTKIQPADNADEPAGQPSVPEATGELPDYTAEQIAGMKPEEIQALVGNVKKFRASATQKSQEAAEIRRQAEQARAEANYYKTQSERATSDLQKFYDQMSQIPQQPVQSASSQPPKYDPYNPEKSWEDYQHYHEEALKQRDSVLDELKQDFESLRDETSVGLRTLKIDKYLEKALPELGPDVNQEEIAIWAQQHRDADWSDEGWMNTVNQAIRERQAIYNQKMDEKWQKYVAEKEKAQAGAQEVPGSPWAGGAPDYGKFAEMTPAEQDAIVMENIKKSLKAQGGGG
jgi:hypothetical protein